jgi:MYXO-CTERM domain-containing protein
MGTAGDSGDSRADTAEGTCQCSAIGSAPKGPSSLVLLGGALAFAAGRRRRRWFGFFTARSLR